MLDKITKKIAYFTTYSRREAEKLVKAGNIKVNDIIETNPCVRVNDNDIIKIDNEVINKKITPRLWLFNKPRGVITSKSDDLNRKIIYDILPEDFNGIIYVGRLDYNSEGLLLLTNNASLSRFLTQKENHIPKVYVVKAHGKILQKDLDILKSGIIINEIKYAPIKAILESSQHHQNIIRFTLFEGKNNEIRNICEYFNLQVSRLKRISFGEFDLGSLYLEEFQEVPPAYIKNFMTKNGIKF